MTEDRKPRWRREVSAAALSFVIAMIVIPPVVAALAYQSGQAMFWPALESLYTYFLRYTLLAALGVSALAMATRLIINRIRRRS